MSERIERYGVERPDGIFVYMVIKSDAERLARRCGGRLICMKEIRDGESIRKDDDPARAFMVGDRVRLLPSALDDGVPGDLIGRPGKIIEWHEHNLVVDMGPGELNWTLASKHLERFPSRPIPESELNAANRHPMAPWSVVDDARKERDKAIERAEKAEAETLKVKRWFDSTAEELAKTSADLLAAKAALRTAESQLNDAAAKFERWAAVKFRAVFLAHGDGDFSELDEARKLRSHYFPPANEV